MSINGFFIINLVSENSGARRGKGDTVPRAKAHRRTAQTDETARRWNVQLNYWFAASMIAKKSFGFREAPPIRPPSTSGLESSSAAFLAFMEPPY